MRVQPRKAEAVGPVASLDEAIARVRSRRDDLEARGVRYLALFGSLVHAEDQAESDVDVLYELAPGAEFSAGSRRLEGGQLGPYLTDLLGREVDLVPRERVRSALRPRIYAEAVAVIGGGESERLRSATVPLPPREWRFRLDDMLDAAERIEERIAGHSEDDLRRDRDLSEILAWNFQVMGEAVRNLPQEVKDRHREIDWGKIREFRNEIVHRYFDIHPENLWTAAAEELPPLIPQLRAVRDREAAPERDEPGPELEP